MKTIVSLQKKWLSNEKSQDAVTQLDSNTKKTLKYLKTYSANLPNRQFGIPSPCPILTTIAIENLWPLSLSKSLATSTEHSQGTLKMNRFALPTVFPHIRPMGIIFFQSLQLQVLFKVPLAIAAVLPLKNQLEDYSDVTLIPTDGAEHLISFD